MRHRISISILVVCFCFGSFSGHAQTSQLDSFTKSYDRGVTDSIVLAHAYLKQVKELLDTDVDAAFSLVEDALIIGINSDDRALQASCFHQLGLIFSHESQCDLAISYYDQAVAIFEASGKPGWKRAALIDRAECLYKQGRLLEAKSSLEDNLRTGRGKSISPIVQARINNLLAEILISIGEFEEVELYLDENTKNPDTQGDFEIQSRTKILQGKSSFRQQKREEGEERLEQALLLADSIKDPVERYNYKSDVADGFALNGYFDRAADLRNKIAEDTTSGLGLDFELDNSFNQAVLKSNMGDFDDAIADYQNVIGEIDNNSNGANTKLIQLKNLALKNLSETYLESGDVASAQDYLNQYVQNLNALNDSKKKQLESNLSLFSSTNADIQRMRLLEKDKEINLQRINLLEAQGSLQDQQLFGRNLLIGLLVIVLFFVGTLFFFRQRANRKDQLASRLVELRSLRSQMNPHFIFNALNSVNHYIATQDERKANRYLSEFSLLMRKVLSYSELEFIELSEEIELLQSYLQLEHERFADHFQYELEVDPKLSSLSCIIPPMLIQPFVENAIWHGLRHKEGAGKLLIQFTQKGDHIAVVIEDDGVGRTKAKEIQDSKKKKNDSHGISNTKNRLRLVKDLYKMDVKLNIQDVNADGSGTRVTLNLPINKDDE